MSWIVVGAKREEKEEQKKKAQNRGGRGGGRGRGRGRGGRGRGRGGRGQGKGGYRNHTECIHPGCRYETKHGHVACPLHKCETKDCPGWIPDLQGWNPPHQSVQKLCLECREKLRCPRLGCPNPPLLYLRDIHTLSKLCPGDQTDPAHCIMHQPQKCAYITGWNSKKPIFCGSLVFTVPRTHTTQDDDQHALYDFDRVYCPQHSCATVDANGERCPMEVYGDDKKCQLHTHTNCIFDWRDGGKRHVCRKPVNDSKEAIANPNYLALCPAHRCSFRYGDCFRPKSWRTHILCNDHECPSYASGSWSGKCARESVCPDTHNCQDHVDDKQVVKTSLDLKCGCKALREHPDRCDKQHSAAKLIEENKFYEVFFFELQNYCRQEFKDAFAQFRTQLCATAELTIEWAPQIVKWVQDNHSKTCCSRRHPQREIFESPEEKKLWPKWPLEKMPQRCSFPGCLHTCDNPREKKDPLPRACFWHLCRRCRINWAPHVGREREHQLCLECLLRKCAMCALRVANPDVSSARSYDHCISHQIQTCGVVEASCNSEFHAHDCYIGIPGKGRRAGEIVKLHVALACFTHRCKHFPCPLPQFLNGYCVKHITHLCTFDMHAPVVKGRESPTGYSDDDDDDHAVSDEVAMRMTYKRFDLACGKKAAHPDRSPWCEEHQCNTAGCFRRIKHALVKQCHIHLKVKDHSTA